MKDIEKILNKLSHFEKGSRNYNKYSKILRKHLQKNVNFFIRKTKKEDLKIDIDKVNNLIDE